MGEHFFDSLLSSVCSRHSISPKGNIMRLPDQFPIPVWRAGADGNRDFFNKAWLDFTGRKLEQELGDGWASGVHPKDISACLRDYRAAFRARVPFQLQYRFRRYDGEFRWVIDHGAPCDDRAGNFTGYIGACYDITDTKQTEETLQQSEHRFASFMDNLPGFAWMKDLEGRYTFVNARLAELEPYRPVWRAKTDAELWPAEIADAFPPTTKLSSPHAHRCKRLSHIC